MGRAQNDRSSDCARCNLGRSTPLSVVRSFLGPTRTAPRCRHCAARSFRFPRALPCSLLVEDTHLFDLLFAARIKTTARTHNEEYCPSGDTQPSHNSDPRPGPTTTSSSAVGRSQASLKPFQVLSASGFAFVEVLTVVALGTPTYHRQPCFA